MNAIHIARSRESAHRARRPSRMKVLIGSCRRRTAWRNAAPELNPKSLRSCAPDTTGPCSLRSHFSSRSALFGGLSMITAVCHAWLRISLGVRARGTQAAVRAELAAQRLSLCGRDRAAAAHAYSKCPRFHSTPIDPMLFRVLVEG